MTIQYFRSVTLIPFTLALTLVLASATIALAQANAPTPQAPIWPTVWFRAGMDSNAVREATNLRYAAKAKQRLDDGSKLDDMHACGHDAHATWLLLPAKTLVEQPALSVLAKRP